MQRRTTILRPVPALVIGTIGVLVITLGLIPFGSELTRVAPVLLLLIPVVGAGILGGRLVAVGVAAEAAFALALGFLPPIGSPRVDLGADAVALLLFVVVAGAAGVLMATIVAVERRHAVAEVARSEALLDVGRQRTALLRSVSHDLRTPLATIRAVATDLRADVPYDEATRTELLDMVIDEAERLDRLVANLLSLSRIEAGALQPDRHALDLAELVDACLHRLRRLLGRVDVRVDIDPGVPLISGDYTQLDQVLSNLLENAARHSPPRGTVWLRCHLTPQADAQRGSCGPVRLEVSDSGPGVDPDLRSQVFEPFAGAKTSTSSGIGLAICRAVIEAHDGSIWVEDGPEGGACFVVLLPVASNPLPEPAVGQS